MKIAYLGPEGTFSEEAARQYFHEEDVEYTMFETIPDVIEAVGEFKVDKAIVPLENTIEGTINMLLTQCRKYIRNRSIKSLQYDSSASAATALKKSARNDVAAIGSMSLANLLNLNIIDWNIQDNLDNHTRFIIISNHTISEAELAKTMFVITPGQDHSGVLSSILNVFTALSINLSWIESRPTTWKLGVYRFFLEANNSCSTMTIQKAVTILETLGHEVRILGRYSAFKVNSGGPNE